MALNWSTTAMTTHTANGKRPLEWRTRRSSSCRRRSRTARARWPSATPGEQGGHRQRDAAVAPDGAGSWDHFPTEDGQACRQSVPVYQQVRYIVVRLTSPQGERQPNAEDQNGVIGAGFMGEYMPRRSAASVTSKSPRRRHFRGRSQRFRRQHRVENTTRTGPLIADPASRRYTSALQRPPPPISVAAMRAGKASSARNHSPSMWRRRKSWSSGRPDKGSQLR